MNKIYGWTLIELLITLTILCLLGITGIPTFNKLLNSNHKKIALNSLHHLSTFTRNEAIRRNNFYTLCPSEDKIHCGGQWNKTLLIFSDNNTNEKIDNGDVAHRIFTFNHNTPCIEWNLTKRQYIQFKPNGASNGTPGHFKFCDPIINEKNYKVVISFTGRITLKKL